MILLPAAFFFVALISVIIDLRRFWHLDADQIIAEKSSNWNSTVQRRMRITLPAGFILALAVNLLLALLLVDRWVARISSTAVWLLALAVLLISVALLLSAHLFTRPRVLLLPAFREDPRRYW